MLDFFEKAIDILKNESVSWYFEPSQSLGVTSRLNILKKERHRLAKTLALLFSDHHLDRHQNHVITLLRPQQTLYQNRPLRPTQYDQPSILFPFIETSLPVEHCKLAGSSMKEKRLG